MADHMDSIPRYHTPKERRNLQLCQNYRTISLISHPSKVMLKIILNRLQPQAEEIIAEPEGAPQTNIQSQDPLREIPAASAESLPCLHRLQDGLWIWDLIVSVPDHCLCFYFDRVWREALWVTMRKYNKASIIQAIENVYDKVQSAVLFNGSTGECFRTTV